MFMCLINLTFSKYLISSINIFLLVIIVFGFTVSGNVHNQHYEKAIISFLNSDDKSAIIHLKNAFKENPDHLPSTILNAEVLISQGKGIAAEIEIRKALMAGANESYTIPLLMKTLLLQRRFDDVIDYIDNNFYSMTQNFNLHLSRAQALLGKQKLRKADTAFIEALLDEPLNIDALIGRAQVALKEGKFLKSLKFINDALGIEPSNTAALLMSAVIHQMSGEIDIAIRDVTDVLRLKPNNSPARLIYSVLLMERGNMQAANSELEQILIIIPNEPGANFLKYLTSISLGQTIESKKTLSHLISVLDSIPENIKQDFPVFYYLTSVVDFQQGNYNNAEKSIVKYLKINSRDSKAQILHAKIAIAQYEFYIAKSILSKLLLYKSDDLEVLSLFAKVLMTIGDYDKAEYFFKKIIIKQPKNISTIVNLAKLQMLKQQFNRVVKSLKDNRELNKSPEALLLLSKAYLEIYDPKSALQHIEILLNSQPKNSYIHQLKGSALGFLNDIKGAKKSYQKALELSPDNDQAMIHLARVDVIENNIESAIEKLIAQDKKFGPNSALLIELGDLYSANQNKIQANSMYLKALDKNPSSFFALTRLTAMYKANNEIDKAIIITERFINKGAKISKAYALLAKLYFIDKQINKAIDAFRAAVKYNINKEVALLELATFQLRIGELILAKQNLLKAIKWNREYVPAYITLIAIIIKQKDKKYAVELIDTFEKISADTAKVNQLKGDMYSAFNDFNQAELFYQLSLKKKPSKQAVLGLYRLYKEVKQFNKIIFLLSDWLKNNPNDLISAIAYAEIHRDMGEDQLAISYYLKLIKSSPNNPILLNNIAVAYLSVGNYQQATLMAEKAYTLIPNSVTVLDTKAWIETKKGNFKIALSLLRQANVLANNNVEVKYHLAFTLDKLNRRNEALSYLKEAVMTDVNYPEKVKAISLYKQWEFEKYKT